MRREYEKLYQIELQDSVSNFIIAIAYTLYFSETTTIINKDDIAEFMSDLFVTVELFRKGEYNPDDYTEALKEAGINFGIYDYNKVYREKQDKLNHLINEYELKLEKLNSQYDIDVD